jgi:hypothetical protein
LSAGQGAKRARGAFIAVAVLCAAGALYIAWPGHRGENVVATTVPAAAGAASSEGGLPSTAGAGQAPLFPATRIALDELNASVDLRTAVSSESCATANGRAAATATLLQAENSAERVHELIAQSVSLARSAADGASLDVAGREALREDVTNATDRTLMLSNRLRDERLQAISMARHLIAFMEENAGHYEVQDGAVRFSNESAQVQFSHFQVNTTRVLGQELLVRRETADALAEQEQLLTRGQVR